MYLKKKLHKTHKEIEDCDVTGQLDRKLNKLGKDLKGSYRPFAFWPLACLTSITSQWLACLRMVSSNSSFSFSNTSIVT